MVDWELYLTELGCKLSQPIAEPQPCPCHPDTDPTLHVIQTPDGYLFNCTACNFELNPIQLIAKVYQIGPDKALDLFAPGERFEHTLAGNLPKSHIKEYSNQRRSQALIHEYVGACHAKLRESTDENANFLNRLSYTGVAVNELPGAFGRYTPPQVTPLSTLRHGWDTDMVVSYAYKYGDYITAIAFRDLDNLNVCKVSHCSAQQYGVYPDIHKPDQDTLYVTKNEHHTTMIRSILAYSGLRDFPCVSVIGYPLPFKYRCVKKIVFISVDTDPLALEDTLRFLTIPEFVSGCTYQPALQIADLKLNALSPERLVRISEVAAPLVHRIAAQLITLYNERGAHYIRSALQSVGPIASDALTGALTKLRACKELIELVQYKDSQDENAILLANGCAVYRMPTGFIGAHSATDIPHITLSNCVFTVRKIIQSRDGQLHYQCIMNVPNQKPTVITLAETDFNTHTKLRIAIRKAFAEKGQAVTPVFYNRKEFDWREICDGFGVIDSGAVQHEVAGFGVSEDLTVEFPNFSITHAAEVIEPQTKLMTRDIGAAKMYAALEPYHFFKRTGNTLPAMRKLWKSNETGHVALAACISHVIYCIVESAAYKRHAPDQAAGTKHLCLVDVRDEAWFPFLSQLMLLLSGSTRLQYGPIRGTYMKRLDILGSLPYVTVLTDARHDTILRLSEDYPANMIAAVTSSQAVRLSKCGHVNFLSIDQMPQIAMPTPLSREFLDQLRQELPVLIQQTLRSCWDFPVEGFAAVTMPARTMYQCIGKQVLGQMCGGIADLLHEQYYWNVTNMLPYAFRRLRKLFYADQPECAIHAITAAEDVIPGCMAYMYDDVVLLDKGIVELLVEKSNNSRYTEAQLEHQLAACNYLIDVTQVENTALDLTRYWAISRDIWEARVATKPELPLRHPQLRVLKAG